MRNLILIFLLAGALSAQTKFFLPLVVESSNGRPIKNQTVVLYKDSSPVDTTVWLDAGYYYYTDTTVVTPGVYDIYVNGIEWRTNVWIHYGSEYYSVRGEDLLPSAKDTINAFIEDSLDAAVTDWRSDIEDSISTENDTTALKLNDAPEGHLCYLKQLSSANTNGAGWFVAVDSAYAENAYSKGYVYPHPTAAMQWVRDEFLQRGYVMMEWYGALGDGSTDDATAIQNAFNSEVHIVGVGGNTYKLGSTITVHQKDVRFSSNNKDYVKFSMYVDDGAFYFSDSLSATEDTLTADAKKGTSYILVGDSSLHSVSDLIKLKSSVVFLPRGALGSRKGELQKIRAITGDTLWMEYPLFDNYDVTLGGEVVRVLLWEETNTLNISDLHIQYYNVVLSATPAFHVYSYDHPVINHCRSDSADYVAFKFTNCYNPYVLDLQVYNSRKDGSGYGLNFSGGCHTIAERCYFSNCRHGIDAGGTDVPLRTGEIRFSWFVRCDASTHQLAENFSFFKNVMYGMTSSPFIIRGENNKVLYNEVYAASAGHMVGQQNGYNLQVIGNIYNSTIEMGLIDSVLYEGSYINTPQSQFEHLVLISGSLYDSVAHSYLIIKDNSFFHANGNSAAILGVADIDTLRNLVIANNTFSVFGQDDYVSGTYVVSTYDTLVIDKSTIRDNQFLNQHGQIQLAGTAGSGVSIKFTDDTNIEFYNPQWKTTMIDSLWTYKRSTTLDSAESILFRPGTSGYGTVTIDTTTYGVLEAKARFRWSWAAVAEIEDSTGFGENFTVGAGAGKFNFVDNGTHLKFLNSVGDNRTVTLDLVIYNRLGNVQY